MVKQYGVENMSHVSHVYSNNSDLQAVKMNKQLTLIDAETNISYDIFIFYIFAIIYFDIKCVLVIGNLSKILRNLFK